MHDMWCVEADDMHYTVLADRVRYFKEDEEGVLTMCRAMEEMRNDAAKTADFAARLDAIKNIMESFQVSIQQALDVMKIPETDRARYLHALSA